MIKTILMLVATSFIIPAAMFAQSSVSEQPSGEKVSLSAGAANNSKYAQMSISELVLKANSGKSQEKTDAVAELKTRTPSSAQEISALFEMLGNLDPEKGENDRAISEDVRQALYTVKDKVVASF